LIRIIYNQRGFTEDFDINFGLDRGLCKFNYDYLSFPVKIGLNRGRKIYGFLNTGLIPSILINAWATEPYYSNHEYSGMETTNVKSKVTKFDIAGLVEIGGGYKFKDKYLLFTSFVFQRNFTKITNADYYSLSHSTGSERHYGFTLTLGLKCALTKK